MAFANRTDDGCRNDALGDTDDDSQSSSEEEEEEQAARVKPARFRDGGAVDADGDNSRLFGQPRPSLANRGLGLLRRVAKVAKPGNAPAAKDKRQGTTIPSNAAGNAIADAAHAATLPREKEPKEDSRNTQRVARGNAKSSSATALHAKRVEQLVDRRLYEELLKDGE